MRPLTEEDREFIKAELQAPGSPTPPSPEERHAEGVAFFTNRDKRWRSPNADQALPVHKLTAQRCPCENPQTYEDEDGDRRCLCGRAA